MKTSKKIFMLEVRVWSAEDWTAWLNDICCNPMRVERYLFAAEEEV